MKTSDATKNIWKAFLVVQSSLNGVEKTGVNAHLGNRYAKIEDLLLVLVSACTGNGLTLIQYADGDNLMTRVTHAESCEFIEVPTPLIVGGKRDSQSVGSATTYSKRYALLALFGIHDGKNDDDGNASVDPEDLAARVAEQKARSSKPKTAQTTFVKNKPKTEDKKGIDISSLMDMKSSIEIKLFYNKAMDNGATVEQLTEIRNHLKKIEKQEKGEM
jgi:hypothetical protein